MFSKSAWLYDAIYAFKDYAAESARVRELISEHGQSGGTTLLDAACGTGMHLAFLKDSYDVAGLDLDPELLAVARERLPDTPFYQGDMRAFDLGRQYDAVVNLFSAIGYAKTLEGLNNTVVAMARHLKPGGVLVVEPWITAERFDPRGIHARFVDEPDLKIARMNMAQVVDGVSILDFHYLVGTPEGVEYFTEHHELGLYTHEQYMAAFEAADLGIFHDPDGLMGRGLYIGTKPLAVM